jgi:hypothetical protein
VLITRIFVVSAFGLALATGAFAQTTPTAPAEPAVPGSSFQAVRDAHPDWFTSRRPYFPCPSSVGFDGRGACIGCPTRCSKHF